jgi:signal peptidase I
MEAEAIAPNRPRRPLAAVLLSFASPGLGHVYCGRFGKGIVLLFCGIVLGCLGQLAILPSAAGLRAAAIGALAAGTILWVYAMVDARRLARRIGESYALRDYNRWYVYLLLALLALPINVAGAFYVRAGILEAFYLPSASMYPTIRRGERILVDKLAYRNGPVRRGDIVVFPAPNNRSEKHIKRVVALPGDTVEIRDGQLYINGVRLERTPQGPSQFPHDRMLSGEVFRETNGAARYGILLAPLPATTSSTAPTGAGGNFARTTIPTGECFVLGDNRDRSVDSRAYGPIPLADIVGRVTHVYYPRWAELH